MAEAFLKKGGRLLTLLTFVSIALISAGVVRCGSGVGCLGNCEELFAEPGTSELRFAGATAIDRVESNSLRLNWAPVSEASEYLVFDLTEAPSLIARLPASATAFTVLGLQTGRTYRFRVKLLDPLKRTDSNTNDLSATTLTLAAALAGFPAPSSLKIWLKSTSGITVGEEGAVSEWADQSGKGNHFRQPITDERPLFASAGQNGFPEVRFNGVVSLTGPQGNFREAHHFFFVYQGMEGGHEVILGNSGPSGGGVDYGMNISELFMAGAGQPDHSLGGNFELFSYHFITLSSNGASSGQITSSARANGVDLLTNFINDVTGPGVDLRLGQNGGGIVGSISELLFYDSVLSDADRDRIETYLKDRYAL